MRVLEKSINQSAKKPNDYLFTGRLDGGLTPLSVRQFRRLVKTWTEDIGLDASAYGTVSLRRAGAIYR
jgi:replication-associated recombination protein RarA